MFEVTKFLDERFGLGFYCFFGEENWGLRVMEIRVKIVDLKIFWG